MFQYRVLLLLSIMCLQLCTGTKYLSPLSCRDIGFKDKSRLYIQKTISLMKTIANNKNLTTNYHQFLHRYNSELQNIYSEITNKQNYLGNVINSFSLLKRLAKYWREIISVMKNFPGNKYLSRFLIKKFRKEFEQKYENFEDKTFIMSGFQGIGRLQNVYHITADELANGKLEGALNHTKLSAEECYEFAEYFYYAESNFEKSIEWLEEAKRKIAHANYKDFLMTKLLELYSISQCFMGDVNASASTHKELTEKFPKFKPSHKLAYDYKFIAKHGCEKASIMNKNIKEETWKYSNLDVDFEDSRDVINEGIQYWRDPKHLELCNHPRNVYSKTARFLKCRYVHYNKPNLMIGPFKLEEYHLDPPILMFHDVITDKDIQEIKEYGEPKMKVSSVLLLGNEKREDIESRTTYDVWLRNLTTPVEIRLLKRATQFTNMSPHRAKTFQLANYGITGEFRPHIDALNEEHTALNPDYADYCVVMFYLNNVGKGGHTILPAMNATVVPVKGSAILWFNRKPDGSVDGKSLHAGCPVQQGSKWVINMRLHTAHQDFPKCTEKKNSSFKYFYL